MRKSTSKLIRDDRISGVIEGRREKEEERTKKVYPKKYVSWF
jgi:hypothetical protein